LCFFRFLLGPAEYPAPKQGEWVARDFKFHTGEVMPELKLHYTTVGESSGTLVVVLHGTGGSAASMLTPAFAGELFGRGQPLDATKIMSSFRTRSVMGKAPSPPMASKQSSRNTITTTWSTHNTACCPKG
jgi:homoserine O-acetyltransferase/O-succinyltransferase